MILRFCPEFIGTVQFFEKSTLFVIESGSNYTSNLFDQVQYNSLKCTFFLKKLIMNYKSFIHQLIHFICYDIICIIIIYFKIYITKYLLNFIFYFQNFMTLLYIMPKSIYIGAFVCASSIKRNTFFPIFSKKKL